MRKFNIIAGLPRAGSTLICNILNANPKFHVTPTSGIIDSLKSLRSNFSHDVTWKAQNRLELLTDFQRGMKGFLDGFFQDKECVFDKSRGWPSNISLLDKVLGNKETKIIWPYRDPVEIVGSIEAQYQKTILLENADESAAPGAFLTLDRRIGTFINDGGIVSYPIEALRDALEMGYGNRILIVAYYDLCNNPQGTMDRIHDFIGEEKYAYDMNNIKQTTHEYDGFYNYKFLHTIKEGPIKYKQSDVVLPKKYASIINQKFSALNHFVFTGDAKPLLGIQQ